MAAKKVTASKAKALALIQKGKNLMAKVEGQSVERLGRLCLKAGLGDLDFEDAALLNELKPIATKFRNGDAKSPAQGQGPAS